MFKLGKLSICQNVEVFAELTGDTVSLYVPTKKSKAVMWGNRVVWVTDSKGEVLDVWGDNPGVIIAVHQKIVRFLEEPSEETMMLAVSGNYRNITKPEAVCLERDIFDIATKLKKQMVERTLRGVRTAMYPPYPFVEGE